MHLALGKAMPLATPTAVVKPAVAPVSRMDLKESGLFFLIWQHMFEDQKCCKGTPVCFMSL